MTLLRTLAVTLAVTVALSGCTSGSTPAQPSPSPTGTSTASQAGGSPDTSASGVPATPDPSEYATLFASPSPSPSPSPVLGTGTGPIRNTHPAFVARLDVLSVLAQAGTTVVRIRLSTATRTDAPPFPYDLTGPHERAPDIGNVAMVAPKVGQRYLPATFRVPGETDSVCLCSWIPAGLAPAGLELSMIYPALPTDVTSVQIVIPDIPPVTVPVSRS